MGCASFSRDLPGFTRSLQVSVVFFYLDGTGFAWVFPGLYLVLLGFIGFYLVLQGFLRYCWVILGFTGFYLVLPSFTGGYLVIVGFTGF